MGVPERALRQAELLVQPQERPPELAALLGRQRLGPDADLLAEDVGGLLAAREQRELGEHERQPADPVIEVVVEQEAVLREPPAPLGIVRVGHIGPVAPGADQVGDGDEGIGALVDGRPHP